MPIYTYVLETRAGLYIINAENIERAFNLAWLTQAQYMRGGFSLKPVEKL